MVVLGVRSLALACLDLSYEINPKELILSAKSPLPLAGKGVSRGRFSEGRVKVRGSNDMIRT